MPQVAAIDLTGVLAGQLAQNRYLGKIRHLSTGEITPIIDHVLDCYYRWADGHPEQAVADCRDFLARACSTLSIPVIEAAYALYVLRDELVGSMNEPSETITKFFDQLAVQLMRSY